MEKEVKIIPPEGYIIDKENSTFECIKFKSITHPVERWRDSDPCVKGWFLRDNDVIDGNDQVLWKSGNLDMFATEKQAKSALAMAQISQIMANDERFGGVISDKEWEDYVYKYTIVRDNNRVLCSVSSLGYNFLAFHTGEQRDLFLEENKDLVKQYLMID